MSEGFVTIDSIDLGPGGAYHLLNAAIAPRPIAWVSSLAADGTLNIAPHSYTTVLSPNPPIVGFVSVGRKDTLNNVEATGDFVYHIAGEELAIQLNLSAADFPAHISEVNWTGLTAVSSDLVKTPRILEAPLSLEARLVGIHRIGDTQNHLIMGEILRFHLAERVLTNGRIDPAKLRPLGRLAGSQFSYLGELFEMERPTYAGLMAGGAQPLVSASTTRGQED